VRVGRSVAAARQTDSVCQRASARGPLVGARWAAEEEEAAEERQTDKLRAEKRELGPGRVWHEGADSSQKGPQIVD